MRKKNKNNKNKSENYEHVFINGKQVKIKKVPSIDGIPIDEYIEQNADDIWLHTNEMWEYIEN